MKQYYLHKTFRDASLAMIKICDQIVTDYNDQGYRLTIRQLYYQLVARDHIENSVKSYDNIVSLMTNARLAGLIDWDVIEDRTREIVKEPSWSSPSDILRACAQQYREDPWLEQDHKVVVVVEKEALAGVLERTCRRYQVPLLAARGYPSATTLREMAINYLIPNENVQILHLGDHDPSGIDMTRDLEDRLHLFCDGEGDFCLTRIALNMDQIIEMKPPPNPAKSTDSRFAEYRANYGSSSWELDALPPEYLDQLVASEIETFIDWPKWEAHKDRVNEVKRKLRDTAETF